jgi:hypothetical protein
MEGNLPLARAPGVEILGRRPGGDAVRVGSGAYRFSVPIGT